MKLVGRFDLEVMVAKRTFNNSHISCPKKYLLILPKIFCQITLLK